MAPMGGMMGGQYEYDINGAANGPVGPMAPSTAGSAGPASIPGPTSKP